MNSSNKQNAKSFNYSVRALIAGVALLASAASSLADVLPPDGSNYAQFAGRWWKWFMQLPLTNSAGIVHPAIDAGQAAFDVTEGQSSDIWFLAAPFGTVTRSATIPSGKPLFFALLNAEESSLEGFATAQDQAATATYLANHIIDLSCEIDGVPVDNLAAFRFVNPQITFTAPTPWIFGSTGGTGTSVGDGYYIFLNPLSAGQHTIHFGGAFQFTKKADGFRFYLALDMTYNLTVQ